MLDYRDALREEMKAPAFKEAWDNFDLQYEIADLLIRVRSEAGFSQSELAKRVGTTQSAIARMESGKTIPRLESIQKVARACGKTLEIAAK